MNTPAAPADEPSATLPPSVETRTHDPVDFAAQLAAKMASKHRHVCLLLGAGASRACGLPDVAMLQTAVSASLTASDRTVFHGLLNGRNIEEVLSRLRRIAALKAGVDKIDGLTSDAAMDLDREICRQIVVALDASRANTEPVNNLASWIMRARYDRPLEVFTVNYDLLVESALDAAGVPYFDGFVGNLRAAFRSDLVDDQRMEGDEEIPAFFVRLWKLHGSLNWTVDANGRIVRLGRAAEECQVAAIYPSDTKYEESRRIPFLSLQDRFRRSLNVPETLMLVAGYSFADQHLNEILLDAARRRPRSEFIVFCFGAIPDALAKSAATIPNLQVFAGTEAIIGAVRAPWRYAETGRAAALARTDHMGDFASLAAYLARAVGVEPTIPLSLAPGATEIAKPAKGE
jgi:hypothetical protein